MSTLRTAPSVQPGWIAAEFSPEECNLLGYWLSKRDGDDPPRLATLQPAELRPWLAQLQIHELVGDRYLCRLSGTATVHERRSDSTGKYLDEVVDPEVYRSAKPMFDRARTTGLPLRYRGRIPTPDGGWCDYRRLLLPLRQGDAVCDTLLSLVQFSRKSAAASPPPRATSTILGSWALTAADLQESFAPAA